jgi:hypothetical protein
MELPTGMSRKTVELSPGLAHEHGLEAVRGVAFRDRGDGWVANEWPNRHLSGSLMLWRRVTTESGPKHHYQYVPVGDVILQNKKVEASLTLEAEQLGGSQSDTAAPVPGEIEELRDSRQLLGRWLTLSEDEKIWIKDFFAGVTGRRARARHPFNVAAAARAARMTELKDRTGRENPGAMQAMSHPLERNLSSRYLEIIREKLPINSARQTRQMVWLFEEDRQLDRASQVLDRVITHQQDEDFFALRSIANHIRFRVQPFNLLAHSTRRTGNRIEDVDVAITTQNALYFHRYYGYFASPFRQLTAPSLEKLDATLQKGRPALLAEVQQRLAALEATRVGGAYDVVLARLRTEAAGVITALENRDATEASRASKRFRLLLAYHCLPKNDPQVEVWYRHSF